LDLLLLAVVVVVMLQAQLAGQAVLVAVAHII
jgi:hypothetical protein